MKIPNLPYFRALKLTDKDGNPVTGAENLGNYINDSLSAIQQQTTNIEQQSNVNAQQQQGPPPAIDGLTVTGQNGHFNIAIKDNNAGVSRGIQYRIEYADNAQFANAKAVNIGDVRNHNIFLGNGSYYFRAHSSYPSGQPSPLVYFGGAGKPQPVFGGGIVGGPLFLSSQGVGTGAPGHAGQGPGPVLQRTPTCGYDWAAQQPPTTGLVPITGTPGSTSASAIAGGGGGGGVGFQVVIADIAANMHTYPASKYTEGAIYYQTDTGVSYITGPPLASGTWIYHCGTFQSNNFGLPPSDVPTLGANDFGYRYSNAYWGRTWIWYGYGWNYEDCGCPPGTQICTSGAPPAGGQWVACDGGTHFAVGGSLGAISVTASNFLADIHGNNPMIMGGTAGPQLNPSAPTWDPAAKTNTELAHTHPIPAQYTTGGPSSTVAVQSGTGTTVPAATANYSIPPGNTGAGTPHSHVLNNANAKLNTPGEINGGLPLRTPANWYMRI